MRLSLALLLLSMAGAVGGAWLIGQWAVGLVVLGYSLLLAAFALYRDPDVKPAVTDIDGTEEDRFRKRMVADLTKRMSGRSA
jgi:hypothetical protein